MSITDDFKSLKTIEKEVNRHLYIICAIITVITMAMIAARFFTRGDFPSTRIALFYLGVLILYSLHKELVRWLGERKVERQGEYFVYGWIVFTTLLYIINFLSKDFFSYSAQGAPLTTLRETGILTLEVLAIFLITRGSKLIKIYLTKEKKKKA
jgi:hypothetical protein